MKIANIEWIKEGNPKDELLPDKLEIPEKLYYYSEDFQGVADYLERTYQAKLKGFDLVPDNYEMEDY